MSKVVLSIRSKIVASALSLSFVMLQQVLPQTFASQISGVGKISGDSIINNSNGSIYNITPEGFNANGNIGYRQYENFNISANDIANLIYKYKDKDVSSFVNFVQNKININGTVNTMKNGEVFNGNAVFVSPNGMVIGQSGVLNVGSLSVLTPTKEAYKKYTDDIEKYAQVLSTSNNPEYSEVQNNLSNGLVTISGKISAANNININAGSFELTSSGKIITGETLFNSLVNNKINNRLTIANENNSVKIKTIENNITIKGLISSDEIKLESQNADIILGDTSDNLNLIADAGGVDINITNGNLYNSGSKAALIKTKNNGNLNIIVEDGTIGKDPDIFNNEEDNLIDLTKSINADIDGIYTAITRKNKAENDLVINIAAIDSDMKVNRINATGNVILLADATEKGSASYSILNGNENHQFANVEGKGISLTASGNIGTEKKKLTFNQTEGFFNLSDYDFAKAEYTPKTEYSTNLLAIKDIHIKGLNDQYDTHVNSMISTEGSINAEFSGNTYIRETTSADKMNIITRGAKMYIENLGTTPYNTNTDYGTLANIVPDTPNIKVLDINPYTRISKPEYLDNHIAYASSELIIMNAYVQSKPDDITGIILTADEIAAGGYRFHTGLNTDSVYREETQTTNAMKNQTNTPVLVEVQPVDTQDVIEIGRNEQERNYYNRKPIDEEEPTYETDDEKDIIGPKAGNEDENDFASEKDETLELEIDSDTEEDEDDEDSDNNATRNQNNLT